MTWVRINTFIRNWPGGGSPPVFEINSDENGVAVVELAWDPQALRTPAAYPSQLRYYSTDRPYTANLTRDDGSRYTVTVPAQSIELSGNRATWSIPQSLWDAYVQESIKTLSTPAKTTFARNLYYRVRIQAPGASNATIWPPDEAYAGDHAMRAPLIGILPLSASPSSQVPPDEQAIAGLGGVPGFPTLWSDVALAVWRRLPETDPQRRALVQLCAHQAFRDADLPTRVNLLRLWLFGHDARAKLPALLDRRAITGSGVTTPVIEKRALKGGKTLVQLLVELLVITPHPDLRGINREQLLGDVLTEIIDPNGQTNQGYAGTCVPTSMQTLMMTVNPAEYVRLQVGWLSSAGVVELADGTAADVPAGVLQVGRYAVTPALQPDGSFVPGSSDPFSMRTFSEIAFQGAMIKLGWGGRFPANNGTEDGIKAVFAAVFAGGLLPQEAKRVADALFGVNFMLAPVSGTPATPEFAASQQAIAKTFLDDLDSRQQPVLLATYWGNDPHVPITPPKKGYGAHMVLGLRRANGRVLFKNPQYTGTLPGGALNGGNAVNPPRAYVDTGGAVESISEADLANWIYFYLLPDEVLI
ncbi:hypothetical protein AB5J62_23365 [Amycolatopsis sp. cg5]|uniref:hypothetical protein n=1 Tax=Amycolatopsis sp. cg5 TaxID=3238802 RepID=UPI00352383BF